MGTHVARYRLRFVLQEFDLPRGVTLIGRSLDCHLTIEDPLVSRRHARIVIVAGGAQVEDLGSRNGVKVNGASVKQPTMLRNGDRLRIGTQELVFTRVDETGRAHSRTTGQLRLCANCRQPYPREMLACPGCEATEQTDDETLTASGSSLSQKWSMQLFVEALERALRLGRILDAEGLIRRAAAQVEELVAAGSHVDEVALAALAVQAAMTTMATSNPAWAVWAIEIYGRCLCIPPVAVVDRLADAVDQHPTGLRDALGLLAERLAPLASSGSAADLEVLARLSELGQEPVYDDIATADRRSRERIR
jgi:FHA domain-containing protein